MACLSLGGDYEATRVHHLVGGAAISGRWLRARSRAERMRRIGVLTPLPADLPDAQERHAVFLQTLRQLGWTEGGNVRIARPLVRG